MKRVVALANGSAYIQRSTWTDGGSGLSNNREPAQKRVSSARLQFANAVCGPFVARRMWEELPTDECASLALERAVVEVANSDLSVRQIKNESDVVDICRKAIEDLLFALTRDKPHQLSSIELLRLITQSLARYAKRVQRRNDREVRLDDLTPAFEPLVEAVQMRMLESEEELLEVTELFKEAVAALAERNSNYAAFSLRLIQGSGIAPTEAGDLWRRRALNALRDEVLSICAARAAQDDANHINSTLAECLQGLKPQKFQGLIEDLQKCLNHVSNPEGHDV